MGSVPEFGVVVYVSTNSSGTVKTIGVQPMLEETVLYFTKGQVVEAIQRGAVLKFACSNGHDGNPSAH